MPLLHRLKIWQKLALLVAVLGLPIGLLTYLLMAEKNLAIDFAYQEIRGTQYLQPVRTLLQHIAEHRGLSSTYLDGDASFREKITAKQDQLVADLTAMDAVDAQLGNTLQSNDSWPTIKTDWKNLKMAVFNLTAKDSFARHTALIGKLLDLTLYISITSNLVLDPEPETYYLMDIAINRIPILTERLGQLRAMAAGIIARHQFMENDHINLSKGLGQIEMMRTNLQGSLEAVFQANEMLKPVLGTQQAAFATSTDVFLSAVEQLARSDQVGPTLSPSAIFGAGTQAITAGFSLYDAAIPVLQDLLQNRIHTLNKKELITLAGVLAAVLLALLFAYGIGRLLVQALQQAHQVASSIAAGELSHAITITSSDEVGQLLTALETTRNKLNTVVMEINTAANTVSSVAAEIAQGSSELAQRTEEQASVLKETTSSMEELTTTVKHSADHAGQANQLAIAARSQAEQGGQVVEHAITAMGVINAGSQRIANIISVIDEIAFQTNLLALNAAVEAARAGEQGRGFAVVAGEVRKLAQRSADAAKEIKTLISDSVHKIEEGSRLVECSGQTLQQIVTAVKKVSDIVAEIAAAAREQATGIEQVNQAILQMDQVTQQNAALVEQTATASHAMGDQASQLQTLVHFFKLASVATSTIPASSRVQQQQRSFHHRPGFASMPTLIGSPQRAAPVAKRVASDGSGDWEEF